ncbi:uncharacterized protein LOC136066769 [Quercus suber]|uniref:uncharacterized protein LOC136066769 n=1 Tax=Quercus suber TaxID=58331 RepID=UPI000D2A3955|nr:hypothetical protein CFP56_58648 [Quercus suber]
MAESGSGSGSQGPVNFHRPHLKMLVEDANTSKDIRDTISRPLHLLDFLFSDEGFGGFSEPFSKGYPYCKTPGSQQHEARCLLNEDLCALLFTDFEEIPFHPFVVFRI